MSIIFLIWIFIAYKKIINKDEDGIIEVIGIPVFSLLLTLTIYLIITYLP